MRPNKLFIPAALSLSLCLSVLHPTAAQASPWAKKSSYAAKTGGKFLYGLKHALFSWTFWWTESLEPEYSREWEGFSAGVGKSLVYTAAGLIQLATFPVPVDFPDMGIGLHMPSKDCPGRHHPAGPLTPHLTESFDKAADSAVATLSAAPK